MIIDRLLIEICVELWIYIYCSSEIYIVAKCAEKFFTYNAIKKYRT